MPIISASPDGTSGTGTEFKSDRVGYPTGPSDPSSPSTGDLYFNTGEQVLKIYDGTSWINV